MNNSTLKDCCTFQEGYVNPSQKFKEFFGGKIKWLRASDLNDGEVFDTERKLSDKGFNSAGKSAFLFEKNTLAISKSGTIGRLGILKDKMCGNRAVININVNRNLADLYYVFYTLKYKKPEIIGKAGGSIQKNLYVSALETISLNHSNPFEQSKIAKVLSDLDKKIEINNKINAELEAMAKLIYNYWFVQFDFPNANGHPYKSSGGKMVLNEELKREIPEGWNAGNIMQLANLLGGGTPKTTEDSYWNGSIPFFTPADAESNIYSLKTKANITKDGLNSCSSRLYSKGTIFITARGTVGKINIASRDMSMSQSCYALQGKEGISSEFVYFYVDELVHYIKSKASGSIFKALVTNDFKFTPMTIPPSELIAQFTKLAKPMFEKLLINKIENNQLEELREWLLPTLMNGQVTVQEK
jgi:type I restriction enzyme S subunit